MLYIVQFIFIRKLCFNLYYLDWLIKLRRSILHVLLQIVCFQEVLNVSDMEYFMYSSMLLQFKVYNIVENPGRIYLPGTLQLSTFLCKLLGILSLTKSLRKNVIFVGSWDLVPKFLCLYIRDCFCLRHLNFIITLSDLFI